MREPTGEAEQKRVRDRIEKLHALMAEALAIEAQIVGEQPNAEGEISKPSDYALDMIEFDLDSALDRARSIVDQLRRIERRL